LASWLADLADQEDSVLEQLRLTRELFGKGTDQ